jgi:hypothetical protein
MRNIAFYIQEYLFENDSVLIPDLGSFLSDYQPASVEINTKLAPPQKVISFNEMLRTSDGKLAAFVAENESISLEEAQTRIKEYTEAIKHEVRYKKQYQFENLGLFYLDDSRKMQFSPTGDINFFGESFGMGNINKSEIFSANNPTITAEKEELQEQVIEEIQPEVPVPQPEITIEETKELPVEEKILEYTFKPEVSTESEEVTYYLEPKELEKTEVLPIEESSNEAIENDSEAIEEFVEEESKRSFGKPLLGGLLLGGAAVLAGLYVMNKDVANPFDMFKTKLEAISDTSVKLLQRSDSLDKSVAKYDSSWASTTPVDTIKKDTLKNDNLGKVQNDEVPKESSKIEISNEISQSDGTISPDSKRYYIIAGGFSTIKNAQVLKKDLIKKGFNNVKFLAPTGDSKLIKVSAADYASQQEAFNKAAELSQELSGVWVLNAKK